MGSIFSSDIGDGRGLEIRFCQRASGPYVPRLIVSSRLGDAD